jgi:hypothetical protein
VSTRARIDAGSTSIATAANHGRTFQVDGIACNAPRRDQLVSPDPGRRDAQLARTGVPFDDLVAFNDVITPGAIARGAARSAARTRTAWPALSPALDAGNAGFGSQSAAMAARSDQTSRLLKLL